ncbi:hypothetical protein BV22DRAFT_990071, partial [Leucogyrophana mollusca]
ITGDQKAKMHWKLYWRNIVQRYQVKIEGWPSNIPFANLSDTSSALPDLESLLRKWKSGAIHWEKLSEVEYERLNNERNGQLENGELEEPCRR